MTKSAKIKSLHQTRSQVLKPRQILPVAARARHLDRRGVYLGLFAFVLAATFAFLGLSRQQETDAASLTNFDPGNIITDYNMSRYNSMTESEIQTFLKSKNSCNDTRTYLAEQYSSYTYHIENGHFVCMADEKFDTSTGEPATSTSKSTETAAHIIYTVAQEYKINPQVLIVLLQKEQGLITDTWPNYRQYRAATGYGCPDTAACDTKYYGLRNQISNAAKLFRTVLDGGWTNYPLGENYIQYNPNSSCGGTTVNVKNLATSSLYRYTPYQPNKAALNAGYGTGDSCSAYGNRNFYLYFSDWFSDPTDDSTASPKGTSSTTTVTSAVPVLYQSHLQDIGWESSWAQDGALSGTTGQSRRLEAIKIKSSNSNIHVLYQSHLQDIGWESSWAQDGALSGTTGQSRRLEAIKIKLDDVSAKLYDIYYRSHVQDVGWLAWAKNGESSGSEGFSRRLEALEIVIVEKGATAPASSDQDSAKTFVK